MGFWDLFKPEPSLQQRHEADPTICFKHFKWWQETPGSDEWFLSCSECNHTFIETYRNTDTGALTFRWGTYWYLLNKRTNNAFVQHNDYLKQQFYEKFPDADTPNEELAERAREEFDKRIARSNALYDMMRQENLSKPHCPTCNSTDVQPISNVKRIASTAVMGIASSTIGKSYECKKCGYKW